MLGEVNPGGARGADTRDVWKVPSQEQEASRRERGWCEREGHKELGLLRTAGRCSSRSRRTQAPEHPQHSTCPEQDSKSPGTRCQAGVWAALAATGVPWGMGKPNSAGVGTDGKHPTLDAGGAQTIRAEQGCMEFQTEAVRGGF